MSAPRSFWRIKFTHHTGRSELLPITNWLFDNPVEAAAECDKLNKTNNPAWKGEFTTVEIIS